MKKKMKKKPDIEDAIARLKILNCILCDEKQYCSDEGCVVHLAISALKKQIQKKPMCQKYKLFRHSHIIQRKYGKCPVCGVVQADDEYCQHCGQKLDWSETDE